MCQLTLLTNGDVYVHFTNFLNKSCDCGHLLHQRVGNGFREEGEGAAEWRALPVEDTHREQCHAGALTLEGQVEPRLPELFQTQHFDIGALLGATQVVCRHCGHLDIRVLHPGRVGGRGIVPVALVVKKVEGLSAVALVESGTVHHTEPGGQSAISQPFSCQAM